jgi:putative phosphoribosyl transferase
MNAVRFVDREDAGRQLAERLRGRELTRPLVLAIPRGGIEVAVPIAQALGAELDVVIARKLRAPAQSELALGAVSESGEVVLNPRFAGLTAGLSQYLHEERAHQAAEIERRVALFRSARPKASVAGRSVIVTDDGIATGATLFAALRTVRAQGPREVIVAMPVAPADLLDEVRELCDELICLYAPEEFWAVGMHYERFPQVSDERVVESLAASLRPTASTEAHANAVSVASGRT